MVPGTSKDGSASKGLDLPRSLNTEKGSEDEDDLESVASGNSGSTHKSVKRQRSMDAFAVRTSADQKARIDMQVARFFFGSNLPFRVVENNEFSKLVELLRPGYQPSNRKALAGNLLDTVHEEVIQSMKAEITDDRSTLTIMQDGWSNVKKLCHYCSLCTQWHEGLFTDYNRPRFNKEDSRILRRVDIKSYY